MSEKASGFLSADRPIETSEQDELQRCDFARQLANLIAAWRGRESFVIGLHGGWGSGKSSVKNLIIEALPKTGETAPIIVEFDPWMVSGAERITQAFFDEIAGKFERGKKDTKAKKRAASWKKYGLLFGVASQAAKALEFASPILGVPPGSGTAASKGLSYAKNLAKDAAESLEQKSNSLHETKRELRQLLLELPQQILVVIDDLDRLTTDEMCLVFRLVKANADFPNMTYLLLFERAIAEEALSKISSGRGAEYLEKIVQVAFDLPTVSAPVLQTILTKRLNGILTSIVRQAEWEEGRWANLWHGGLSEYFKNIRDIYRFLNSFAFMISSFTQDGALNVNPVDLIALESLRIFEPSLYGEIRENKSWLTRRAEREMANPFKAFGEQLVKSGRASGETVRNILRNIFPELDSIWGSHGWSPAFYREWTSQRRICSSDFFDRYFSLRLPADTVSEATIRNILSKTNDREALGQIFGRLEKQCRLLPALHRLGAERSLDKLAEPLPYLLALVDLADRLPSTQIGLLAALPHPGSLLVRFAVDRVLKEIEDGKRKTQLLETLITETTCIGLTADWIQDFEKSDGESVSTQFDEAELTHLKLGWVERVRLAAKDGRLLKMSELSLVLERWIEWAGEDECKTWVLSIHKDPKMVLDFLAAQIRAATSNGMDRSWMSWKALARFQPREWWGQAQKAISRLNLGNEEKRVARLFRAALTRWDKGIDDQRLRSFHDDGD